LDTGHLEPALARAWTVHFISARGSGLDQRLPPLSPKRFPSSVLTGHDSSLSARRSGPARNSSVTPFRGFPHFSPFNPPFVKAQTLLFFSRAFPGQTYCFSSTQAASHAKAGHLLRAFPFSRFFINFLPPPTAVSPFLSKKRAFTNTPLPPSPDSPPQLFPSALPSGVPFFRALTPFSGPPTSAVLPLPCPPDPTCSSFCPLTMSFSNCDFLGFFLIFPSSRPFTPRRFFSSARGPRRSLRGLPPLEEWPR